MLAPRMGVDYRRPVQRSAPPEEEKPEPVSA